MPVFDPPRLDDRTFDDLRRELVRRIPIHSPEWTDHHPSDPGITILELFAWLTENLLRRVERVPENTQLQFLKLLGMFPRPAAVSRVYAQFSLRSGLSEARVIESGPLVQRTVVSAGKVEFQIEGELDVLPVEGVPVVKWPGPTVGVEQLGSFQQALMEHLGAEQGEPPLATYETRQLPTPQGDQPPPPTSIAGSADGALWIALLAPERLAREAAFDPVASAAALAGRILNVGVLVNETLCGPADHHRCPDPDTETAGRPVVWQIATGRFRGAGSRLTEVRYTRLAVASDGTGGLARTGVVRLELPKDAADIGNWTAHTLGQTGLDGVGDLPPAFDDPALDARVLTWVRCFRMARAGEAGVVHPVVRWMGVNVVEAEQARTARDELLGTGAGRTGQTVRVTHAPVLADSLLVEVREPDPVGWVRWHRVPDLGVSRPDDPHYLLDPSTGDITFGDGIHGRMPRLGEYIRARTYRYGGGAAGNVSAGTVTRVIQSPVAGDLKVTNPLPASGGQDGETIERAKARIPRVLRHRERAVAAQDFSDLAMETPGVQLGRVEVLPRHKPHERVDEVPGVVTLVIVPAYDPLHTDEPTPDREMLRRVCAHLEPRRLVTTELYITPPEYVPVWVSVAIEVKPGYGLQTVRRWVDLGIRQFFAPLPPYGPAGSGWPFGRAVRKADVAAAVLQVEGVRLVNDVLLDGFEIDGAGARSEVKDGDRVMLRRWQLTVLREVQVVAGETAEPIARDGDASQPDAGAGGGSEGEEKPPLLVPVVEDEC